MAAYTFGGTGALGIIDTRLAREREGHREYVLTQQVKVDDPANEGPETVLGASGLPTVGQTWGWGSGFDGAAFCTPQRRIRPKISGGDAAGDLPVLWIVDSIFSTISIERCQNQTIENPLLEPDRIRGGSINYTEEKYQDRNGLFLMSSSFELFRGPDVEFDDSRDTVTVEQTRISLDLPQITAARNKVNSVPMWGMPVRTIKLSDMSWERRVYGTCTYYFIRTFTYDIKADTFDRPLLDQGYRCLKGKWNADRSEWNVLNIGGTPADPDNPAHFDVYKDGNGENTRVFLDGTGKPAVTSNDIAVKTLEYYDEYNFFTLGMPASFTV